MAEKAEQPAAAEAAVPEVQEPPKPKLKKPVKPDVEEHKAAVEKLQQEFNRRRDRMDQLKQLIDHKRNAGDSPEVAEARKRLNQLTANFKAELVSSVSILRPHNVSHRWSRIGSDRLSIRMTWEWNSIGVSQLVFEETVLLIFAYRFPRPPRVP